MFSDRERRYLETADVGRLATADAEGRPHVVPVCYTFVGDELVTPIDEKPQTASSTGLRRSRNVRANPRVALIVDHYTDDWSHLGWVQIRGTAAHVKPSAAGHQEAVDALRDGYDQYADHDLEDRPLIRITPGTVVSWGTLERPGKE